jgi:hypothetical protein
MRFRRFLSAEAVWAASSLFWSRHGARYRGPDRKGIFKNNFLRSRGTYGALIRSHWSTVSAKTPNIR